jgi:hypothetical protein
MSKDSATEIVIYDPPPLMVKIIKKLILVSFIDNSAK